MSVHLLKNIRNNLLTSKRFIFPKFEFHLLIDPIIVPAGEMSWNLLHRVYEEDEKLTCNLRKAHKLTYRTLHPGNNKQRVQLALNNFHETTITAIKSYFPEEFPASEFLTLVNMWWIISNSKSKYSNNLLGHAAVAGDNKPAFLRHFSQWIEEWQCMQLSNCGKFTLTKQTMSALIQTLKCTADLIEDLLQEGFDYVLISRLQSDPLERRFSKYRQMSAGRFLVALREVLCSEKILQMKSLFKENLNLWELDVRPEDDILNITEKVEFMGVRCMTRR